MKRTSRRTLPALLGVLSVAGLATPALAQAHGIVGRADLPIPVWLFSWTAAIVLVVSFVALSTLWTTPRLQRQHRRQLVRLPRALEWLASAVGLGLFALVVYSGFAGAQVTQANFSVTFIYVIFWVGMPLASVLFGDVFRALSPWRTCARLLVAGAGLLRGRRGAPQAPLRYPARLGLWPAAGVIVGFAWMELVYVPADRDHPATLAALSLAYLLVSVIGMLACGIEEWGAGADGFGAYFGLLARMSALCRDEQGYLCLRRRLSGLTSMPVGPGTIGLICAVIGTTTFDGFSNGGVWRNLEPNLQELFASLGLNVTPAIELAYSFGLIFCLALVGAVYRIGIAGVRSVSSRYQTPELMRSFAHTLVPIGFAYVLAHYFSLLIWQGQAIGYLASDPLGNGANLFGTGSYQIDYTIISFAAIWYVQVAALVAGHVGGLTLAHDRALVLYPDVEEAVRSQYWMLAVMVAFTSFGLWLLSAVGT
ncbi:MAG TPA: fenitrothion hydrolase [Solirubrobacteraceae bacterium]|nr:fenitrothion hydrolase [Solirubrobacteraceae bacterium]